METKTRTIKIRVAAYRKLKVMAAERGETMLDLLDRLIGQEGQTRDRPRPGASEDGRSKDV